MSEKSPEMRRKPDRRVQRTRDVLGDALITLMHEKAFDDITVQDVLDLAGVSRSTFYAHFRDKDDLFLSDADEFFEHMANVLTMCGDTSRRVAPVREMFEHVASLGTLYDSMVASGNFQDAMELAQEHFARGIERRLNQLCPAPASFSRVAQAYAFAGAMFSLMRWWLDHGKPASPAQMDEDFHRMVWAGVGGK
ncbi:MAG TPA: TetR/AcrR family transcriptional regulator [Blastocatellia bacterium]|nr:TetR/AcrR family transcriptional regulator [Blastocatellia bacterium]HMV82732.1 TetR/AcrR family transcriptional regulator [Blastocatellia bacterium]HMX30286.1 TetR/AcrR family transcriptional regulator [Blastocatellia bacterium]HMZ16964.1 TetR/AcrR family transcriptional regulator [Blastocatellia bacterium]HNG34115.1 TetR/AcrR family transcriptional regulator [Blastocatellia bacterium]